MVPVSAYEFLEQEVIAMKAELKEKETSLSEKVEVIEVAKVGVFLTPSSWSGSSTSKRMLEIRTRRKPSATSRRFSRRSPRCGRSCTAPKTS